MRYIFVFLYLFFSIPSLTFSQNLSIDDTQKLIINTWVIDEQATLEIDLCPEEARQATVKELNQALFIFNSDGTYTSSATQSHDEQKGYWTIKKQELTEQQITKMGEYPYFKDLGIIEREFVLMLVLSKNPDSSGDNIAIFEINEESLVLGDGCPVSLKKQ